ncbi:hypothetical protein Pcac1_g11675 [Phytophthora cactorum]|nr:hypothetical protein Pcac1_g11675 [Phytophthora cactorum]
MPVVGNGSDARPFLVGMTTKALLRNAVRDPGTFVLHLDATFKLNSVGYPVLVCGITDASRSFHLLALFITSQLQEGNYSAAHLTLRRIYARVNGMEMRVTYVLGDADKAQYKAFRCVFADSQFTYLMCFYHVVAKLRDRSRGLSSELVALVFRGITPTNVQLLTRCRTRCPPPTPPMRFTPPTPRSGPAAAEAASHRRLSRAARDFPSPALCATNAKS